MGLCCSKRTAVVEPVAIMPGKRSQPLPQREAWPAVNPELEPAGEPSVNLQPPVTIPGVPDDANGSPKRDGETLIQSATDESYQTPLAWKQMSAEKPPSSSDQPPKGTLIMQRADTVQLPTLPEESQSENILPQYKINPTIPSDFHPSFPKSELEIQCQTTVAKVSPRESEADIRSEIQQLLHQWKESGQLAEIENHALSIPPSQTADVELLSENLTSSQAKYVKRLSGDSTSIEIAKAYAIYFWLANNIIYDVGAWQAFLNKKVPMTTEPDAVLQERKSVCLGYAKLYHAVSSQAGLESTVVHGHIKTPRIFAPGGPQSEFEPCQSNSHSWNAVKLGGVWFPVDCTFGSGVVTPAMEFTRRFTRGYFAAPPQRMILTHWPADESWQLLESPISLNELKPLITPHIQVFNLQIEPQVWGECVHIPEWATDPVVQINVNASPTLRFTADLQEYEPSGEECIPQYVSSECSQSTCVYIQRKRERVCIHAIIPHKGCFSLNVYVQQLSEESHQRQQYQLCLSYQVKCDLEVSPHTSYPQIFSLAASAFDFTPLHWNLPQKAHICDHEGGNLEVVFQAQAGLQYYHCLIPGRVPGSQAANSRDALFHFTMVKHDTRDPTLHVLQVVFPTDGWWTVCLCASKVISDEGTTGYTALMNYEVFAKKRVRKRSYPRILSSEIQFELPDPIFASGNEILTVPFTSSKEYDFHSYLTYEHSTGEGVEGCTQLEEAPLAPMYALKVIFPRPGKWYVHVFARDKANPATKSYSGIFDLCIEVDGAMKNATFPCVNSAVARDMSIQLVSNDPVVFHDDGKPLRFQFIAPKELEIIPSIEPVPNDHEEDPNPFRQHCTFLSSETSGAKSTHTLTAVFPHTGKWSINVFACRPDETEGKLAIKVVGLEVTNPITDIAYPKVFPAFRKLGLSLPETSIHYTIERENADFEFPFNAPEDIHFVWNMQLVSSDEKLPNQAFVHHLPGQTLNRILHLIFPHPGTWLVQLFAKHVNKDGTSSTQEVEYESILELRFKAMTSMAEFSFPQTFESFRTKFGIRIDKNDLPLPSRLSTLPFSVTIRFYSPSLVKFWHSAQLEGESEPHFATRMTSNPETGLHELVAQITETGQWTVTLYAQYTHLTSKNWIAVLRHVILA